MPPAKLETRRNEILDRFGEASKAELGEEIAGAFVLDDDTHYADQITAQLDRTLTSEEREERFRIGVLERAYRFYDESEEEEE